MEQVITLENEREILENIANEYDISLVETTIGMNGYPKQLRYAITDFKSFEQYCEIKDKYHLNELNLHRKDGWVLWERHNTWSNQPYTAEEYVEKISGDNNKIIAKFEEIKDNESIVEYPETCYQSFDFEVIPNEMCGYYNDTNYYQFGLYISEINEEVIALNYYIENLCYTNRNKKFSKPFAINQTQIVGIDDWGYFLTIHDDSFTIDDMDYTSLYNKLELKNFLEIEFNIQENERKLFFSEE